MCYHIINRFCLLILVGVVLFVGTATATTPSACVQKHCTYLPLVSKSELVSLSNVGDQGTRFEYVAFVGEANATTSRAVYSVTLEVRSYDSQDNLIDVTTGTPKLVATLPGQPNPFYLILGVNDNDDLARTEVRVTGYSVAHTRTYLPIRVTITSYENFGDRIDIAGTLTNDNITPLEDIQGVAWTTAGDMRSVQAFAPRLEAFETIPFSTSIGPVNLIPGTDIPYSISVQGAVP